MDQATITRLVKRYIDGIATAAEEQELMEWYREKGNQDIEWLGVADEEKLVRERMLKNILIKRQMPVVKRYTAYYAVAASLLIGLSVASLFYFKSSPKQTNAVQANVIIHPGKNQAVLILANGTKVALNDAKHGLLAKQGNVIIKRAQNGQIIYDLSASQKSESNTVAFNTIVTPRGGQYAVILPDGSHVWLNSESSIKFPTTFTGHERKVQLIGEAYFEVAKNKAMPFKVDIKGTQVEVLGTHFNVNGYDGEKTINTTLLEGSVKVVHNNAEKLIKPGQQAQVDENIQIEDVDAEKFIAWKDGYFVSNDEDIHTLMNRIARWYDIDVAYGENVGDLKFTMDISKYKDVSEILRKMEITNTIHFKIEGRRITVMK